MGNRQLCWLHGSEVGGLELCWGDHVELAVQAAVVEPIDVLQGGELDILEPPPRSPVAAIT